VRARLTLWIGLFALAACDDDVVTAVAGPEAQIDEFEQVQAAEVDILWVVDNSQSMLEEQELLAENFDRFIQQLTSCVGTGVADDLCDFVTETCVESGQPCNTPDYHVGVISTDRRDEGRLATVGVCAPGPGVAPEAGKTRYCRPGPNACAPDPENPDSDPANGQCDVTLPLRFVTPTTTNPIGAFQEMVQLPTAGGAAAFEEGIATASQALGIGFEVQGGEVSFDLPAPIENDGFLRETAPLFVIFVSDEEDKSFGPVPNHYRRFETLKGGGNEALISASAIVGDPDLDGPDERFVPGCGLPDEGDEGDEDADARAAFDAGRRYIELALYSRGVGGDLRVCDGVRLRCGAEQTCVSPIPELPGICLPARCSSAGQCGGLPCSGESCQPDPQAFVELLRRNGIFGSICSEDYGPVLDQLGFDAAGLSRRFDLSLFPDCSEDVPCCDEGVAEEDCEQRAPVCVKIDGNVTPNDRAQGWIYDEGGNAVFFDGDEVPSPGADIQVSYVFNTTDQARDCGGIARP